MPYNDQIGTSFFGSLSVGKHQRGSVGQDTLETFVRLAFISQGNLVGHTVSYTEKVNDRCHVSSGGAVAFEFVPDGKAYRTTDEDNSVSVTRASNNVFIFHRINKGKEWDTMREELSADGNTLSDTDTEVLEDGGKKFVTTVYVRVGPGQGFAGKWKSVKLSGPHVNWIFPWSYVMTTTGPDTVKWEYLPITPQLKEGRTLTHRPHAGRRIARSDRLDQKRFRAAVLN